MSFWLGFFFERVRLSTLPQGDVAGRPPEGPPAATDPPEDGYSRSKWAAELLAVGRQRLSDDPSAALAFAIASLEHSDNDGARRFAVEATWNGPPAFLLSANEFVASEQAGWSPDGLRLALSRRALHLVELASGKMRRLSSGREVSISTAPAPSARSNRTRW